MLLQEVWVDADAQLLIASGRAAGLVHATHFRCVPKVRVLQNVGHAGL